VQLGVAEPAARSARPRGSQRLLAAGPPAPPPLIGRLRAHPQPGRHLHRRHVLGEQPCRLHPHRLPPSPRGLREPTTIGISHPPGIERRASPNKGQACLPRSARSPRPQPFKLCSSWAWLIDRRGLVALHWGWVLL